MNQTNETKLYEARTHYKVLFKPFVIQLFLLLLHFLLVNFLPTDTGSEDFNKWAPIVLHGLVIIAEIWYVFVPVAQWWTSIFTLTSHRVYKKWGILYKQSREISLQHVVSVNSERGILDRIFGCGTLVFLSASSAPANTSGAWNKKDKSEGIRFEDVPRIKAVMNKVEQARFGLNE